MGYTCQNAAYEQEDAEEDVSGHCAPCVHDLSLGDGENDPKQLKGEILVKKGLPGRDTAMLLC